MHAATVWAVAGDRGCPTRPPTLCGRAPGPSGTLSTQSRGILERCVNNESIEICSWTTVSRITETPPLRVCVTVSIYLLSGLSALSPLSPALHGARRGVQAQIGKRDREGLWGDLLTSMWPRGVRHHTICAQPRTAHEHAITHSSRPTRACHRRPVSIVGGGVTRRGSPHGSLVLGRSSDEVGVTVGARRGVNRGASRPRQDMADGAGCEPRC